MVSLWLQITKEEQTKNFSYPEIPEYILFAVPLQILVQQLKILFRWGEKRKVETEKFQYAKTMDEITGDKMKKEITYGW